jgi:hypothetical protein
MDVYTVIQAFDLPLLGMEVTVGSSVSKLAGEIDSFVNTTEWDNKAFYQWIGSPDSLNYLNFTGTVPDPSSITNAAAGVVALTVGQDYYTLTGAAFGFIPTTVVVTVAKPGAPGSNIFATLRDGTLSADGFTVDFSTDIPGAGYELNYVVFQ